MKLKRLVITVLMLTLLATSAYVQDYVWVEYDWRCIPQKDHYVLATNPPIEVSFLDKKDYYEIVAKFYPGADPESIGGFIAKYSVGSYRSPSYVIYIPRNDKGWGNQEISETSLGHEIMHILWWDWHKDQSTTNPRK